ncbi:19075_t:CDS:2, partial [Rhizophagus irregularis]
EIEDNPTNAITSLYRQIFKTQTKISGSVVMADKLTIMVFSLGASKKESWLDAG